MRFELTILGSSSAIPTMDRNLTSQVLNINEKFFMLDCGDGTQLQVRRQKIKFQRINHIFISHLHGDHFFGLIGLLSTMQLLGRTNGLNIYGPKGIDEIINMQLKITGSYFKFPIEYHFLTPGKSERIIKGSDFYVDAFPVKHSIEAWGFLFSERHLPRNIKKSFVKKHDIPIDQFEKIKAGADYMANGKTYPNEEITEDPPEPRSYAYCSDTAYSENIIPYIRNCDLLYHEATFADEKQKEADEKLHSTAREAGKIAQKSNAGKLLIGHFSARYKKLEKLLEEAREEFPNTHLAVDGKTYKLPVKKG